MCCKGASADSRVMTPPQEGVQHLLLPQSSGVAQCIIAAGAADAAIPEPTQQADGTELLLEVIGMGITQPGLAMTEYQGSLTQPVVLAQPESPGAQQAAASQLQPAAATQAEPDAIQVWPQLNRGHTGHVVCAHRPSPACCHSSNAPSASAAELCSFECAVTIA